MFRIVSGNMRRLMRVNASIIVPFYLLCLSIYDNKQRNTAVNCCAGKTANSSCCFSWACSSSTFLNDLCAVPLCDVWRNPLHHPKLEGNRREKGSLNYQFLNNFCHWTKAYAALNRMIFWIIQHFVLPLVSLYGTKKWWQKMFFIAH